MNVEVMVWHGPQSRAEDSQPHTHTTHNSTWQRNFWIRDEWKFSRKTSLSYARDCWVSSLWRDVLTTPKTLGKSEKLPLITNSFRLNPDGWWQSKTKDDKKKWEKRKSRKELERTAETAKAYRKRKMICDMIALGERTKERKKKEIRTMKKKNSNPIYLWLRFEQWQEFASNKMHGDIRRSIIRAKTDVACSRIQLGRTLYHFEHYFASKDRTNEQLA